MPLLSAGGVCCCTVDAGLAGAEEADEFDGAGIAVGVGLVVAGGGIELERFAGAGELDGVELAAGALAADVSADFLERDFFVVVVSATLVSALSALSADFLDRLFFLGVAASVEAVVVSAESALLFFERLFFAPVSAAELSVVLVELSAASADFLERLFFVVDLLLSVAVELSAESAPALFLERLFFAVEESAAAELSALSELFFLDLDFVLLVESAESVALCDESSALAFFLDFFLVVVELSL